MRRLFLCLFALLLCLSAEALAADWPQLESHTFRFKDPLNHDRQFIPLGLDELLINYSASALRTDFGT